MDIDPVQIHAGRDFCLVKASLTRHFFVPSPSLQMRTLDGSPSPRQVLLPVNPQKFLQSMLLTVFEKLQLADEKNLLIQGLPSSIEKQFSKLSFAKNMTPLLKNRKIDFALVFAVNENQLNGILKDVMPSLKDESKFWVAYPKTTSKIVTDLNRECSWNRLTCEGYESIDRVELDHCWSAMRFVKSETAGESPVLRSRMVEAVAD